MNKDKSYPGPQDIPTLHKKKELEAHLAPHIATARKTLTSAKERFLQGFPEGYLFYVTIALKDAANNAENVYIRVLQWKENKVTGLLATQLLAPKLKNLYQYGQKMEIEEKDVIDWTITDSKGTEEGNFIGKFLDSLTK